MALQILTRRDALRSLAAGWAALSLRPGAGDLSMGVPPAGGPQRGEVLIRGGRVVNADGVQLADVRILDATITEMGAALRPGPDARVIDATGKLVMPGGIDPHTHLQPSFIDTITTGSMAALAGGVTTVGTFANPRQGETTLEAVERLAGLVRQEAIADVILHAAGWPPTPELAAALPALVQRGQPSVKVFLTRQDFGARVADFILQLEAARDAGVVTMVHCEDGALLAAAVRRLVAQGRTSLAYYGESRPVVAEVAATAQAVALCESTGAPMYAVHLSSERALDVCRRAKAVGAPFYVETRPLYLHLDEERMRGPDRALFVGQPPLRSAQDVEAMWAGMADGSIDVLATDHAPWTREQKLDPELSVSRVRPGVSNLQFMLPMYFSEGVVKRGLPLERFVATTSTNAARIFGMFPRKGAIRVGSDADVLVWDPSLTAPVRGAADLSNSDYSVYEGWEVTGWPVLVMRRGEVVYEDRRIVAEPGTGTLVSRERWSPPRGG